MGAENIIKYDSSLDKYFPTREYEENSEHREYIEEYEEDSFCETLIYRLADRDFLDQYDQKKVKSMSFEERMDICGELEAWYSEEFEKNGLQKNRV